MSIIEEVQGMYTRKLDHEVSIIIPAFNEAGHIAEQIRATRNIMYTTDWQFEIIVVDDGSVDGTGQAAAAEGVRVLRHRQNRGYGAALKQGIDTAGYDWILITDADGTYPSEAIPELLAAADDHEMVVGARVGHTVKIPLVRRPAKWFLGRLASYLAGCHLPDLNSGLRLMRKDLIATYRSLLPSGFSFTTTITLAAVCNDYQVAYVPINYYARHGKSKIRPWHAYDFALLVLRTIVCFNPLKIFLPTGALLALIGLAKGVYDVSHSNLSDGTVLALLGALIIWAMGLLADQNARMMRRQ